MSERTELRISVARVVGYTRLLDAGTYEAACAAVAHQGPTWRLVAVLGGGACYAVPDATTWQWAARLDAWWYAVPAAVLGEGL